MKKSTYKFIFLLIAFLVVNISYGQIAALIRNSVNQVPVNDVVIGTTSSSATWSPNLVFNSGATLIWTISGGPIQEYFVVSNDPVIDLSSNTGNAVITIKITSPDGLFGLEQLYLDSASLVSLDVDDAVNLTNLSAKLNPGLTTLNVLTLNKLQELTFRSDAISGIDLTNNVLLERIWGYSNTLQTIDLTGKPNLIYVQLNDNNFSQGDLDIIIQDVESNGTSNGELILANNPGLTGTAASYVAYSALLNRGWTIDIQGPAPPPSDNTPPVITSFTHSNVGTQSVELSATATDAIGVTGFDIYVNTALWESVSGSSLVNYSVSGLNPNTSYTIYVRAKDLAGNQSSPSSNVNFVTLPFTSITIVTNSTSAAWTPNYVTNTGEPLVWSVSGGVIIAPQSYSGNTKPVFNMSSNTGTATVTVTSTDEFVGVTGLSFASMGITSADFDALVNVTDFETKINPGLQSLDMTSMVSLQEVAIRTNDLQTIDLSGNPALWELYIYNNPDLAVINIDNNPLLTVLSAYGCNLNSTQLDYIVNKLDDFGLSNGNLNITTQNTGALLTSASYDSYTGLVAKGWNLNGLVAPSPPFSNSAPVITTPLSYSEVTQTSVKLTCVATDDVGVNHFEIRVNGSWVTNATPTQMSFGYVLQNLTANTSYSIVVQPYDDQGLYVNSGTVTFTTLQNVVQQSGKPILTGFRIDNAYPSRVYFDATSSVVGLSKTGFIITGKGEPSSVTIDNDGLGGYFTVSTPFTFWDNNTIRLGSVESSTDVNNIVHNFTMEYIDNLIAEPSATTNNYYVATNGNDSNNGTSIGTPFATLRKAAQVATAGSTVWIKAGTYSIDGDINYADFANSGTATSPIKYIGYKTTPGDITENYLKSYSDIKNNWSASEMPTFVNTNIIDGAYAGVFSTGSYLILKNIQAERFSTAWRYGSSMTANYVNFERMNIRDGRSADDTNISAFTFRPYLNNNAANYFRFRDIVILNMSMSGLSMDSSSNSSNTVLQYWLMENIKAYCDVTTEPLRQDYYLSASGHYGIVKDCYAEQFNNLSTGGSVHGMGVRGGSATPSTVKSSTYILFVNNEVYNVQEGFYARNHGSSYNVFKRNKVGLGSMPNLTQGDTGGFQIVSQCDYNVFENNIIEGVSTGIWFTEGSEDIATNSLGAGNIIRNNIFKGSEDTHSINSNSFIYMNSTGIVPNPISDSNKIYNNTITDYQYFIDIITQDAMDVVPFDFSNNLITNIAGYNGSWWGHFGEFAPLMTFRNNDVWDATSSFSSYIGTNGNVAINPNFVNLTSFVPQGALQIAPKISGVHYDYNNKEREDVTTIGAVTLTAEEVITPTTTISTLSGFIINSATPTRLYFESSSNVQGLTSTDFVITGKTIVGNPTINGTGSIGHYFTVSTPFVYGEIVTIERRSSDLLVEEFSKEYVVNNVLFSGVERFVTPSGAGLRNGLTKENSWSLSDFNSATISAGTRVNFQKGNYNGFITNIVSGTSSGYTIYEGYNVNPGDVRWSQSYPVYGTAFNSNTMPLFYGDGTSSNSNTFMTLNSGQHHIAVRNFQVINTKRGFANAFTSTAAYNIHVDNFNAYEPGANNGVYSSTDGMGFGFYPTATTPAESLRAINSYVQSASMSNFHLDGSNNFLYNNKSYSNRPVHADDTDYMMTSGNGSYSVWRNNYVEKVGNTGHDGHGYNLRTDNTVLASAVIENHTIIDCEIVNVINAVQFRGSDVKYNKAINVKVTGGVNDSYGVVFRDGASFNTVDGLYAVNMVNGGVAFQDTSEDTYGQTEEGNIVKNSIFKTGGSSAPFLYISAPTDGTSTNTLLNNKFYNNTIYDYDYLYRKNSPTTVTGTEFKNNIIHTINAEAYSGVTVTLTTANNDFYNNSWDGSYVDVNGNIDINPVFADLISFVPTATFTSIDATKLTGVDKDYNRYTRAAITTIGAVLHADESGEIIVPKPETTIYYVSSTGNDSNDGLTEQTSWQTISKVNTTISNLTPTNSITIKFKSGDEWNSRIVIDGKDQTTEGKLILTSYGTGNKPKINVAPTQSLTWTSIGGNIWQNTTLTRPVPAMEWDGDVAVGARLYSELGINVSDDGLDPRSLVRFFWDEAASDLFVYSTDDPSNHTLKFSVYPNNNAIYVGNSSNITIDGLELEGGYYAAIGLFGTINPIVKNCTVGYLPASAGIEIAPGDTGRRTQNIIIDNNILDTGFNIDYSGANGSEHNTNDAVQVWDALGGEIKNNYVKNWGHSGIQLLGNDPTYFIENIKVYGNTVTAPDIAYGAGYGIGIQSRYCEVYNNIHIDGAGASTHGGYRNHFHNNLYLRTRTSPIKPWQTGSGIAIQGTAYYPFFGLMQENIIENNTIIDCDSGGITVSGNNYNNTVTANIYRNNIIYNCGDTRSYGGIYIDWDYNEYGDSDGNIFQNNMVYHSATKDVVNYYGNAMSVTEFNAHNGTHGHTISNNFFGDPVFVNASSDYHLQSTSPGIGTGLTPLTSEDREGNIIPYLTTGVDLGAYESTYPNNSIPYENPHTYGPELLTNTNFEGTWTAAGTYSFVPPNWVTTGSPNTATSNVTEAANKEVRIISSVEDGPWIYQSGVTTVGKTYKLEITVSAITNGWLKVTTGSVNYDLMKITAPGTYFARVTITDNTGIVIRAQGPGIDAKIASMSVKELTTTNPDYYVSATGTGNGLTEQTPMSYSAAQAVNLQPGDIMAFKGGDEFYGRFAMFNKAGTVGNPITLTSYGTGQGVIKGTTAISGWTTLGGNIWEASTTGLTVYHVLKGDVPMMNARLPEFTSRYTPNSNYYIAGTVTSNSFISSDLIGKPNLVGGKVHLQGEEWSLETRTITAFNSTTGQVTFDVTVPLEYGFSTGDPFYVSGDYDLLSVQDEWHYDSTANKLYIYSTTQPTNIQATTLDQDMIVIDDGSYITIDNLKIKGGNKSGIWSPDSDNIVIKNNTVVGQGTYGIAIYSNNTTLMRNNIVKYAAQKGIWAWSDNSTLTNTIAEYNNVSEIGLLENMSYLGTRGASGAYGMEISDSSNGITRYNNVVDVSNCGIVIGGLNGICEFNYVKNPGLVVHDAGAIYCDQPGSIIRDNVLILDYDIAPYRQLYGVYNDFTGYNILIEDNSISGFEYGIFSHHNSSNDYLNNTIYNGAKGGALIVSKSSLAGTVTDINFLGNNIYGEAIGFIPVRVENSKESNIDYFNADNNKYFNKTSTNVARSIIMGADNSYTLANWRTASGEDALSIDKGANTITASQFIYNETAVNKTINLTGTWEDLSGVSYSGSVVLSPYTSKILIVKDTNIPNTPTITNIIKMATATFTINLNGGDVETADNALYFKIYGNADGYTTPIATTGTDLADANVSTAAGIATITNVSIGTETMFKVGVVDGDGNESVLSEVYIVGGFPELYITENAMSNAEANATTGVTNVSGTTITVESSDKQVGSYAIKIASTSEGTSRRARATFTAEADKMYKITFWGKKGQAGYDGLIWLSIANGWKHEQKLFLTDTWTEYSIYAMHTTGGTVNIDLYTNSATAIVGTSILLDNLSIKEFDTTTGTELATTSNAAHPTNESASTSGFVDVSSGSNVYLESTEKYSGDYSVRIEMTVAATGGRAEYRIPTTIGKVYTLRCWAKKGQTGTNGYIGFGGTEGWQINQFPELTETWTEYIVTGVATQTSSVTPVRFGADLGGSVIGEKTYIDVLSIKEHP